MTLYNTNMDEASQNVFAMTELNYIPPTVVDHTEYDDGVIDLHLLDDGTENEPRFLRSYPDPEKELEAFNV